MYCSVSVAVPTLVCFKARFRASGPMPQRVPANKAYAIPVCRSVVMIEQAGEKDSYGLEKMNYES